MLQVIQAVDDGDRGCRGQTLHGSVVKGTVENGIHVAAEHAGRVLHRLPSPQLQVLRIQEQRRAAELGHPDLEGDAGSRGGLLEDHGQGLAQEGFAGACPSAALLQSPRLIQQRLQVGPDIQDGEEVAFAHGLGQPLSRL